MGLKIYTRTGDKGETSLFGGKRVPKYHVRVEAYGTVDELNSAIGLVLSSKYKVVRIRKELERIQNDLLDAGSALANSKSTENTKLKKRVEEFEEMIDDMTNQLPLLRNFILPGGGEIGSLLHFARTVSRRAERRIVELSQKESIDKNILIYINRLSDLLFTMARFVNMKENKKEMLWIKNHK